MHSWTEIETSVDTEFSVEADLELPALTRDDAEMLPLLFCISRELAAPDRHAALQDLETRCRLHITGGGPLQLSLEQIDLLLDLVLEFYGIAAVESIVVAKDGDTQPQPCAEQAADLYRRLTRLRYPEQTDEGCSEALNRQHGQTLEQQRAFEEASVGLRRRVQFSVDELVFIREVVDHMRRGVQRTCSQGAPAEYALTLLDAVTALCRLERPPSQPLSLPLSILMPVQELLVSVQSGQRRMSPEERQERSDDIKETEQLLRKLAPQGHGVQGVQA